MLHSYLSCYVMGLVLLLSAVVMLIVVFAVLCRGSGVITICCKELDREIVNSLNAMNHSTEICLL